MMSQGLERTWIHTVGSGRFRGEWVKVNKIFVNIWLLFFSVLSIYQVSSDICKVRLIFSRSAFIEITSFEPVVQNVS